MVQGRGQTGAALVEHREVDGVVFTGSYATGRRIRQATFDMPQKKLALELGGKNPAVVLDDADLDQAVRGNPPWRTAHDRTALYRNLKSDRDPGYRTEAP